MYVHWPTKWWCCCCAAIAAGMVVVSGCLEATCDQFVRYDPGSDTFHFLTVFTHIRGEESGDLEYVVSLARLRSHLILPVPEMALFEEPAYVRRSDSEYLRIALSTRTTKKLETRRTAVSLNSVSIHPGRFFMSKASTLCYYHQVSVPGKTLDAAFKEAAGAAKDWVTTAVREEIQRRRKGGKTLSWDVFRANPALNQAEEQSPDSTEQPPGLLAVLNDESLRLLLKQATNGDISIRRQGTRFETAISLSESDCQQAQALIESRRDEELRRLKADPAADKISMAQLASLRVGRETRRGLIITLDSCPLWRVGRSAESPLDAEAEKKRLAYTNTVAFLRERGIAIDENLTFSDILRAFVAGML